MEKMEYSYVSNVCCDMLNIRYEKVFEFEFLAIVRSVEKLYNDNLIADYKFYEQYGASDYRHNLRIQTGLSSEGAIFIGWHHNSAKPNEQMLYDMKVELNPSKQNYLTDHSDGYSKTEFINDIEIYKIIAPILDKKVCRVIEFDIAIDLPYKMAHVLSIPLKGRNMNLVQGTRYYGQKHKDMYLKIYDKAKERKEKTGIDVGTDLTRLEFSIRPANGNGLTFTALERYLIDLDKYYLIALYTDVLSDINVRSHIYSILSGYLQFSEFNHRQKKKIVETIENELTKLSINQIISNNWINILTPISEWCFESVDDKTLEDFMERFKYNQCEQYEHYVTIQKDKQVIHTYSQHFKEKKNK